MQDRCPNSRLIANAELEGFRFIINSWGVATIVPDISSIVHGVLWQTTPQDESSLDRYEGVKHGTYSKEYMQVKTEDEGVTTALVYVAADSVEGEPRNGYMERILKAAQKMGFPESYISELMNWVRRR
jgi:gamma-glutamylcyclotransferase (GGCT)/AIG2-like uncharacterized protein YtfP